MSFSRYCNDYSTIDIARDQCLYHNVSHTHTLDFQSFHILFIQPGLINTLTPRKKLSPFRKLHFQKQFFRENVWISLKISLNFVAKVPVTNIPTLVQIILWFGTGQGNKPSSGPLVVSLQMHKYVTRPRWVKGIRYYIRLIKTRCYIPRGNRKNKYSSTL